MEEVTALVVEEIVTRDRDDPIIKSGLASRNHKQTVSVNTWQHDQKIQHNIPAIHNYRSVVN